MSAAGRKVWLVTGAGRGIGRAIVLAAARRGDAAIAGVRTPGALADVDGDVREVPLDVTDPAAPARAVSAALEAFGRLDVVANVAGTGLVGAFEETAEAQARALFEVNFWGAMAVVRAALPTLRAQRSGRVLQFSSLTGRIAAPGVGFYAATKFALEGLSESLHAELAPLGVHVTIVEPGGVRTDWAGASLWTAASELEDYAPTAGRTRAILAGADGNQPTTAAEVAEIVLALTDDPSPPRRLPIGPDAFQRIGDHLGSESAALAAARPKS